MSLSGDGFGLQQKGMVKVSMVPYIEEIMNNFPEEMGTLIAMTPAGEHLF